jgi:replicative DNA helicase
MVQLQILNKVLDTKSLSICIDNQIGPEYFTEYPDEFSFINEHWDYYKQVPDLATFVSEFPDFQVIEVTESDRYLVDTIREEYLYTKSVPVIKKAAELLKGDANEASKYLQSELVNLTPNYTTPYVDILHDRSRFDVFKDKSQNKDKWFIPSGFEELDEIIGGFQMGEEYVVLFARTGNGKSWVCVKMAEHAVKMNKNVGYVSPEMSPDKIGYRFDTLHHNFSNRALVRGDTNEINEADYENYFDTLSQCSNQFCVVTPKNFNKKITVSKLRGFIQANKLDILFVDGITYMSDERYKRGDNKTTSLTNISEDLIQLSCELKIPIIVVVQSNREGIKDNASDTPDIENIRDSDGISHNATKIISLKQKGDGLILEIKKNRDGAIGVKICYLWDIDKGEFTHIDSLDEHKDEEPEYEFEEPKPKKHKESKKVVF